ncbi:MAG TPA: hypothetical protein PKW33_20835 [Anaerolineaceae bacterium]|nr:hypothetical protein [Anaerolineaceae bacterium]HPN54055.1 hypothetical protein [Anaerolineaceae bacterium]
MTLSSDQAADYLKALQFQEGDGASHYRRVFALETELTEKYGRDGLAIRLQNKGYDPQGVFALAEAPEGCPWRGLAGLPPDEAVMANFAPLAGRLPKLVGALKERCSALYAMRWQERWYLLYILRKSLYDGQPYLEIAAGGAPELEPKLPQKLLDLNWRLPEALGQFYAVHNGFGNLSQSYEIWWAPCIHPVNRLNTLSEVLDPIKDLKAVDYDSRDLLEICPHGDGDGEYFHRRKVNDPNPKIRYWCHEGWWLGESKKAFFAFVDEQFSQIDEE